MLPHQLIIVTDNETIVNYGNALFRKEYVVFTMQTTELDYLEVLVWPFEPASLSIDYSKLISSLSLWQMPVERFDILDTSDADQALQNILALRTPYVAPVAASNKPVASIVKAHGLVGELADWITATAWRPQPKLSLSAALVLVGYLKGRKYITETGVHSNVYAFNVAGSASGKDRPQAALKYIMARLGVADAMLHPPASGTGFIDELSNAGGHGLMCIDEMAEYISGAFNKNSGAHQKKVFKYWLEAFTSCNTYLDGERRSDASKEKAKRVERPLFCLLGSTTPDSLRDSLSGSDIGNGLLNRFLFVQSETSPRKRKARDVGLRLPLPEAALDKCKAYLEAPNDDCYGLGVDLHVVPFSSEAAALYDTIDDYYEDECQRLSLDNRLRNLYGRAHEYVGKVALILCDDREINVRDIETAQAIVKESVKTALAFCGDIADTREEKDYVQVKQIIRQAGKITASELSVKTQRIQGGARRRAEIIQALMDVNLIGKEEQKTAGRPSVVFHWLG